ncbi:hypothetical protein [Methylacidimicrobium sp. B4]|uniref:hypothetical protein n=1 Tax=Methylacidimicrobium sp. B4 TaxID=2796139 RepID=UPI001A8FD83D|nr:hypothetical protein [Methylacidimicrobium sp. B4]QSR83819.1 hypothetical protein MacB4_05890 [Methylacidimicrobium sp. B4]
MSTARLLGIKTAACFLGLGSCLVLVRAAQLPVRLLSDHAYAQLVPGRPISLPAPSPRLVPRVQYQEEIVLENGDQSARLRFYSEEDPASPPLSFQAWERERAVEPVREIAPEELVRLGEKSGNPVLYAWTIPLVFAPRETKRIRIEAEYAVQSVSERPRNDRFETYFSFWGWQPSTADLLFRFDPTPMISAIPCLGRSPTPGLAPWLLSSWFTIRPAGYQSRGLTVWWRFQEARTPEHCEKICVEWPAWYR